MKSFKTSRLLTLFTIFVLLFGLVTPFQTHAIGKKVHFVALGDSLAAGQTPFKTPEGIPTWDKGFSGYMADFFETNGNLVSYSNKFAVSGYRTQEVLDDIVTNKEVDGVKLQDSLQAATVITITAGANDVLREAKIDAEKGTVTIDPLKFGATNVKIQENLKNIMKEITSLNAKAEIYVSGYYNPFPYLPAEQQTQLNTLLSLLNGGIKSVAEANGATFVSMAGIFDGNHEKYLPNPRDIHPSLEGYQLMADQFINAYHSKANVTFEDVPENFRYYHEIHFLVENRVMTGISNTHFGPTKGITRADAAMAIMNILPYNKSIPADPGFSDVPKNHQAYMAIAQLTEAGVFSKAEKFNPNASFTRAQMAKVFTIAFDLKVTQQSNFKDVTNKHWAKAYVDALLSAKITTGAGNNTFLPNKETSREHFALFILRAANNVVETAK